MTRRLIVLLATIVFCLPRAAAVQAQQPGVPAKRHTADMARAFDLRVQELELKIMELEIDEASAEVEKIKHHFERTAAEGDKREIGILEFELKQAIIRREMRKVALEIGRLRLEQAKNAPEQFGEAMALRHETSAPVTVELVPNSDVFVLRGKKQDVERTRAIMEKTKGLQPQDATSDLEVKVFSVVNASAKDLMGQIQALYVEGARRPIQVTCDPRTNSVIVRGPTAELKEIEAILLRLDSE